MKIIVPKFTRLDAIDIEPEFFITSCISLVSSIHVGVSHSDGNDEVYVEMVYDIYN
jgi:hypothetical protein